MRACWPHRHQRMHVNNVNNAAPGSLRSRFVAQRGRIADTFRPWGVRVAMRWTSASPQKIGGLAPSILWTRVSPTGGTRRRTRSTPHSRPCRLHRQGRFRGPPGPASLRPHACRRRQHACCARLPRTAALCSIAPSSTTIISIGRDPRTTAPAPPTISFIPSTASSRQCRCADQERPHRLSGARARFAVVWRT